MRSERLCVRLARWAAAAGSFCLVVGVSSAAAQKKNAAAQKSEAYEARPERPTAAPRPAVPSPAESAAAPGVTPVDEPTRATAGSKDRRLFVQGFLRTRADFGYNWDLNRGGTPSQPGGLFPPGYTDGGKSRSLTNLDTRLFVDADAEVGFGVRLHVRAHVLDNLRYGSAPESAFVGASVNQTLPDKPIDLRQAFGQVLLPFGVLSAGRMGALVDWGTGFFVNSGNGLDDDFGDVGDRIAFSTPLFGLLWSLAFEVSAAGPGTDVLRPEIRPAVDLDRADDVRTLAFSVARWDAPDLRRRFLAAGRTRWNAGVLASYRWQAYDLAPGATPNVRSAIRRDLSAFALDAWARLDVGRFTLEAELAYVYLDIGNASLDPSVVLNAALRGSQLGGVFRFDWRASERFFARLEVGFASGDSAPGFGARPGNTPARPGDVDGLQFDLGRSPADTRIDNFRFHPNYRIDLLLWRRLIGTVTDAIYVRPMVRGRVLPMLTVEGAVVTSFALQQNSPPGGRSPLGVETDIALVYEQEHGFVARLEYGLLVPMAGFRNEALGVEPSVAHALHLVLAYRF